MNRKQSNIAGGRRPRAGIASLAFVMVVGPSLVVLPLNLIKGSWKEGHPAASQDAKHDPSVIVQPVQKSNDLKTEEVAADGPTMEMTIKTILGAGNGMQASEGFEALFADVTPEELEQLKFHEHLTISLTAAWEEVRLTFPSPPREDSIKVDTQRFVGYVEGRLGCPVPDVWERAVTQARASDRWHSFFRRPYGSSYRPTDFGPSVPRGISLTRRDGAVVLKSGTVSIPLTDAVLGRKDSDGNLISGSFVRGEGYLAVHSMEWPSGFAVSRIDPQSGEALWTADVWGGLDVMLGRREGFYHWVGLLREKDLLIVFGVATQCAYIEGFSALDGSPVFRFNTIRLHGP